MRSIGSKLGRSEVERVLIRGDEVRNYINFVFSKKMNSNFCIRYTIDVSGVFHISMSKYPVHSQSKFNPEIEVSSWNNK